MTTAWLVWVLVSYSCDISGCAPLDPQPPRMEFPTKTACLDFATEAAKQGGLFACVKDEGV